MEPRTLGVALGAALATALVVGVGVTAALASTIEFSALVGLPAGLLAGAAALATVGRDYPDAGAGPKRLAEGAAGFGYAVLALAAARYVALADPQSALGVGRIAAVGVVAGVAVALGAWFLSRTR